MKKTTQNSVIYMRDGNEADEAYFVSTLDKQTEDFDAIKCRAYDLNANEVFVYVSMDDITCKNYHFDVRSIANAVYKKRHTKGDWKLELTIKKWLIEGVERPTYKAEIECEPF